ncbi:MAG TPA: hypothetical protein VJ724_13600 [Tahibacter sp.]|nr:hypothetical protein [Tahibacter sp.]
MDTLKCLVTWVAVGFLFLGLLGYFYLLMKVFFSGKNPEQAAKDHNRQMIVGDAAHNIGLPTCALTAFAIVVVLDSTIAAPGEVAIKLLGIELRGLATPVMLWTIVYLALVLSMRMARNDDAETAPVQDTKPAGKPGKES